MATWTNPLFARADRGGRTPLSALVRAWRVGELLIPWYQRPGAWTDAQASAWVGYVLSGAPCPTIFIRQVNMDEGFRDELLDGQQRLVSCVRWLDREIPAVLPHTGEEVWCRSDRDARELLREAWPCVTMPPETTHIQAAELYLTINTAGTPHTPQELQRVREGLEIMRSAVEAKEAM